MGKYFNSKYKNSKCGKIGIAKKDTSLKENNLPGPGQYVAKTEFGIY